MIAILFKFGFSVIWKVLSYSFSFSSKRQFILSIILGSTKSIFKNSPEYPFIIASVRGPFSHLITLFSELFEEAGTNLPIKSPNVVSSVKTKVNPLFLFLEYLFDINFAIEVIPTPSLPVKRICFPFSKAI